MKNKNIAVYTEDDWIAEVEILEDTSDSKWERYKLKVIKTTQESRIYKPTENGYIFDIDKNKRVSCYGVWNLDKAIQLEDNKT